jgi:NADH-quinone oxidoreductase subunit L
VLLAFLLGVAAVYDLSNGIEDYATAGSVIVDAEERRFEIELWEWLPAASAVGEENASFRLSVPLGFQLDPLSAVMLLVVTGVGFLIHVYSIGYMHHEKGVSRFFAYLNLFMAMMLTLVLGNNFLVMFVGWEGVGLCSYLLIGYYTDKMFDPRTGMTCSDAGRKAFIVNRIGDFAFIVGMLFLFAQFGTLDFSSIMGAINEGSSAWYGAGLLSMVGVLLFVGACGKSAQIPLYVWLPDAMAGPTPVSALIHAATMVTAGVYMVARCSAIYWHAPAAMGLVAVVGCATAVFAATMGLCQTDIKKILAYSTVSQLGYMFLGAGVGAFVASIFHLMTHAFFKACLFLGSGSVIHAMGGEQDIRRMGGLRRKMPATYVTFLIATIAIAGFPPLAGFFSKDEILAYALTSYRGHVMLWIVGTLAAGLTAFYMFRLTFLTFFGRFRGTEEQRQHVHESPPTMTTPLKVLAFLALVGGLVGVPKAITLGRDVNLIEQWLHPAVAYHGAEPTTGRASFWAPSDSHIEVGDVRPSVEPHEARRQPPALLLVSAGTEGGSVPGADHGTESHGGAGHGSSVEGVRHLGLGGEWGLILLAVAIASAGLALAWAFYRRSGTELAERAASALGPVYRLVANKYWVDELYDLVAVRPFYLFCRFFRWIDQWIVDGAVNGTRHTTIGASHASNGFDRWGVDLAVNGIAYAFRGGSWLFRRLQTGFVQSYVTAMIFGTFVLLSLYLLVWNN